MIHLLWCTIRPGLFKQMHSKWIERAKNAENIKTYVAVNWQNQADELKEYIKEETLIVVNTDKIGVCYPCYQLSSKLGIEFGNCSNEDIVVFASDDFLPPQYWDIYLSEKLSGVGEKCLMVRDGYQLPDSSNMLHPVITIPIMTYGCLRRLNGIIYHPAYNHMFSDGELYLNLKEMGLLYDDRLNDTTVFEHYHYAAGKRSADQADKAYNMKWKDDELTWSKRKLMPIEERLKV